MNPNPTIRFRDNEDETLEILGMTCRFPSRAAAAKAAQLLIEIGCEEQIIRERRAIGNPNVPKFDWVVRDRGIEYIELTDNAGKSASWFKGDNWQLLYAALNTALDQIRRI